MRVLYLVLLALVMISPLEAGGWGTTDENDALREERVTLHGETWNEVFFDMNGLSFTALIPNYSGGAMRNSDVTLSGKTAKGVPYLINTSFGPEAPSPEKLEEFMKLIQEANPDHTVVVADPKNAGCIFAVDLRPTKNDACAYWRFACTKDRLIKMGTLDVDESLRATFFESLTIH